MNPILVVSVVGLISTPALAQNSATTPPPSTTWPGAEIVEGVAFQGDGSVTLEAGEGGVPVLAFWRPILFREETDEPVAGRMDCRVVAAEGRYSDDAFDPEALHEANAETRAQQGYKDEDLLRDYRDHIRRLDVVGHTNRPRRYHVLSYIMVRDGERLIDIRRNCSFIHGSGIGRIDPLPYVERYTKISYAFNPNDGSGT